MDEGWFKIHRCLFKKAIWLNSTPEQKVIMITILGMANHENKEWEWKGKHFKVKPGEFVTSANSIVEKAGIGISRQNVRSALIRFKKYEFLTYESTNTGVLIKIVNWKYYQEDNGSGNHIDDQKVTKESTAINQQLTADKNDTNYENDKKYSNKNGENGKNYENDKKYNNKNYESDRKYRYIYEFTKNKRLIETIIDFLKMRKEIKKPMTDRAIEVLLRELRTLSEDEEMQIKILEKSIQNCWQGIFKIEKSSNFLGYNKFGKGIGNGIYGKGTIGVINGNAEEGRKEDGYGYTGSNTEAGEKKFNIKIPKWEPETGKGEYVWDEPI